MSQLRVFEPLKEINLHLIEESSFEFAWGLLSIKDRIDYHTTRLESCLQDEEFMNIILSFMKVGVDKAHLFGKKLDEVTRAVDAESFALMQSLRALFDIFAQIINSEVISPAFATNSIYFTGANFSDRIINGNLKNLIQSIVGDAKFIYINDFVNINKHIKPSKIDGGSINLDTIRDDLPKFFKIKGFIKSTTHGEKTVYEILNDIKPWADNTINDLCLALKIAQEEKLTALGT